MDSGDGVFAGFAIDVAVVAFVVAVAIRDLPISCCSTARISSERRDPPAATVAAAPAPTAGAGVGGAAAAAAAACFSNIEAFCNTEARERSSASPASCAAGCSVIFSSDVGGGGGVGELT